MSTDKRENYYLLLELSLEREETDPSIIKNAIKTKLADWTKKVNNKPELRKYTEQWFKASGPGEKAILDSAERRRLFLEAKDYAETEIPKWVDSRRGKGYLSSKDVQEIAKGTGISEIEAKRISLNFRPDVPLNEAPEIPPEKLPKDFNLKEFLTWASLMRTSGIKNLYSHDALGLSNSERTPFGEVQTAIVKRHTFLDNLKANRTTEQTEEWKALGIAKSNGYFASAEANADGGRKVRRLAFENRGAPRPMFDSSCIPF